MNIDVKSSGKLFQMEGVALAKYDLQEEANVDVLEQERYDHVS